MWARWASGARSVGEVGEVYKPEVLTQDTPGENGVWDKASDEGVWGKASEGEVRWGRGEIGEDGPGQCG